MSFFQIIPRTSSVIQGKFDALTMIQKVRLLKIFLGTLSTLLTALGVSGRYQHQVLPFKRKVSPQTGNRLVVLGMSLSVINFFIRVTRGRPEISTSAKNVQIGVTSFVQNFFYTGTYLLATKTGYGNANHSLDGLSYAAERGYNALFKLIGSKCRMVNFPVATKQIVQTRNQLRKELANEISYKEIATEAQQFFSTPACNIFDFLPMYDEKFGEGGVKFGRKGICQGMVQVFISTYHQERRKGSGFVDAAEKAAQPFSEGATFLAAKMQFLHEASILNQERFDSRFQKADYSSAARILMQTRARSYFGHQLLSSTVTICNTILFSHPREISILPNGSYDFSLGFHIAKEGEDGLDLECEAGMGHAVALLVEDGAFLIFNPTTGLFSHPDPDRYFEVMRTRDDGIMFCMKLDPLATIKKIKYMTLVQAYLGLQCYCRCLKSYKR